MKSQCQSNLICFLFFCRIYFRHMCFNVFHMKTLSEGALLLHQLWKGKQYAATPSPVSLTKKALQQKPHKKSLATTASPKKPHKKASPKKAAHQKTLTQRSATTKLQKPFLGLSLCRTDLQVVIWSRISPSEIWGACAGMIWFPGLRTLVRWVPINTHSKQLHLLTSFKQTAHNSIVMCLLLKLWATKSNCCSLILNCCCFLSLYNLNWGILCWGSKGLVYYILIFF